MAASIYSRYYGITTLEKDGRLALQQRPRRLRQDFPDSIEHTIVGTETLDQISARYYSREDLWWRIADANPAKFPSEWKAGDTLVIPPIRIATRTPRR